MAELRKFGTFGVFVLNFLTIPGVILSMRIGWVVGAVGLRDARIILGLANGIAILTSFVPLGHQHQYKSRAGGAYLGSQGIAS